MERITVSAKYSQQEHLESAEIRQSQIVENVLSCNVEELVYDVVEKTLTRRRSRTTCVVVRAA